jgi:molybdopterin-guanine dinucleotide biosynthesis protein A
VKRLPVSGFVLAGGKSSRMGADKAGLMLGGRPLVARAVEKLANFCADVAIVGNRNDLVEFAPVVTETRLDTGPGAGIEAGLRSARHEWSLFVPVDVPLLPVELLRKWAAETLADDSLRVSYLVVGRQVQPSICLVRRLCLEPITRMLDGGERRLKLLFSEMDAAFGAGSLRVMDAAVYAPEASAGDLERWFLNVNTPSEMVEAERLLGIVEG